MPKQKAWDVYVPVEYEPWTRWLDTVFFDDTCDKEYVRQSLIDHDGYSPNIFVEEERK